MTKKDLFDDPELKDGQYIVRIVGAVFDPKTKKVLLGRRKDDPYIKGLTWCFPGSRTKPGEQLEDCMKRGIKEKTGIEVASLGPIYARMHPEKPEFLTITYLCEPVGGELQAGEKFVEAKWFEIEELEDLDTAIKVSEKVVEYLKELK